RLVLARAVALLAAGHDDRRRRGRRRRRAGASDRPLGAAPLGKPFRLVPPGREPRPREPAAAGPALGPSRHGPRAFPLAPASGGGRAGPPGRCRRRRSRNLAPPPRLLRAQPGLGADGPDLRLVLALAREHARAARAAARARGSRGGRL